MAESRTYGPTPRRLADARAEGRVAKSPLLAAGLGAGALALGGERLCSGAMAALTSGFSTWPAEIARISTGDALRPAVVAGRLWPSLGPVLWIGIGTALAAGLLQVGLRFTPRALGLGARQSVGGRVNGQFDPRRLWGEFAILCLALLIGAGSLGVLAYSELPGIVTLMQRSPAGALELSLVLVGRLVGSLGAFLCVLAALDWARRRHALLCSLRMTRSEIERERRELETNPRLRARQRQAQHAKSDRLPS